MDIPYDATELKLIRESISEHIQKYILGSPLVSEADYAKIKKEYPHTSKEWFSSFKKVSDNAPELFRRLTKDSIAQEYSLLALFPETIERMYSDMRPRLDIRRGNRGFVVMLLHPEKDVVIKPVQFFGEEKVAHIADAEEIGPKQYTSIDGFISEEYIDGTQFNRVKDPRPEDMFDWGKSLGQHIKKLHTHNIVYNDTTLANDYGDSHVIIREHIPKIIDFGVSFSVADHPNYTDQDVFNFMRAYPGINGMITGHTIDACRHMIPGYRRDMVEKFGKEGLLARDEEFISEGLYFLRLPYKREFLEGFKKTYY